MSRPTKYERIAAEHKLASEVMLCRKDYSIAVFLSKLARLPGKTFLTKSPINVALMCLWSDNLHVRLSALDVLKRAPAGQANVTFAIERAALRESNPLACDHMRSFVNTRRRNRRRAKAA